MAFKNKLLIFLIIFFAGQSLFAKDFKIKEPKPARVIVVGKIDVVYNEDKTFIGKTFALSPKEFEYPDIYERPKPLEENCCKDNSNLPYTYENKKVFFDICWNMKNKIRYKSLFRFHLFANPKDIIIDDGFYYTSNQRYSFSSEKIQPNIYINLPAVFEVEIPKNAQVIYIGTIRYYVEGDDFEITKIEIADEYDSAKEEFNKVSAKKMELYNAVEADKIHSW